MREVLEDAHGASDQSLLGERLEAILESLDIMDIPRVNTLGWGSVSSDVSWSAVVAPSSAEYWRPDEL